MIENRKEEKLNKLDFETWMTLWRDSPENFESCRAQRIAAYINSVPAKHRERLRCLQWRIDKVRERAANPLAATIAISEMMWKSFDELGSMYKDLAGLVEGRRPQRTRRTATVLPFNRTAFARS